MGFCFSLVKALSEKMIETNGGTDSNKGEVASMSKWMCNYCNTYNDDERDKCQNCGRLRPVSVQQIDITTVYKTSGENNTRRSSPTLIIGIFATVVILCLILTAWFKDLSDRTENKNEQAPVSVGYDRSNVNENTSSVPQEVLNAKNSVVQTNLTCYDQKGNKSLEISLPGIIGYGMGEVPTVEGANWKHIITSQYFPLLLTSFKPSHYEITVTKDGKRYDVERVGILPQKKQDVSLLLLENEIPESGYLFFSNISNLDYSKKLKIGDTVYVIYSRQTANDSGLKGKRIEDKIVSGSVISVDFRKDDLSYIQVDIPWDTSLIGAPLLSKDGFVVGLISRECDNDRACVYATPSDDIVDILVGASLPYVIAKEIG